LAEYAFPHLLVEDVIASYGEKRVLAGVSVDVWPGEVVAIIRHNGAGKSTLLKAVFGLLPVWHGHIALDSRRLNSRYGPVVLHKQHARCRLCGGSFSPSGS